MPCYKPMAAYYGPGGVKFKRSESFGTPVELPCGYCVGCRLEKAKSWAIRCHHEASLFNENCFITLTYNDENLPQDSNLKKEHFQKFIRALRQKLKREGIDRKIRYYMCGEYGDETKRPHYHAILFNWDWPDKYLWRIKNDRRYYRSDLLESLWTHGNSDSSDVTFQSAGYVARYIMKKQNGENAELEYAIIDPETGEVLGHREAPYTAMSLRPGIGTKWYEQNKTDLFPHDYCVLPDGRQAQVPSYYHRLCKREDPELYEQMRTARIERAKANPHNSPSRLEVREIIQEEKLTRLTRKEI